MDVYLAKDDDWDDVASDFFHQRCETMLAMLTSLAGDGAVIMETALHALTGED